MLVASAPSSEFQSTLPRRERQWVGIILHRKARISIHAPAKGATPCETHTQVPVQFQSTLPRRERLKSVKTRIAFERFQSTLPRRERPWLTIHESYDAEFQSTLPRRERQWVGIILHRKARISIHAPAKGATAFINIFSLTVRLFLFHLNNKI